MKVSEIFYSIEGEGIEVGRPEVFLRLAGCNLRCRWCDTEYALGNGERMSIEEIIQEVSKYSCKNLSITGGEPLIQKAELAELIRRFKNMRYWIQINTNGTIFDKGIFKSVDLITMDCKCPSSGMKSDFEVLRKTKEFFNSKTQFKFVISNKEDYEWAKEVVASLDVLNVVFQPEWNSGWTAKLIELVKEDGLTVRVILQQQKIIWGMRRGI